MAATTTAAIHQGRPEAATIPAVALTAIIPVQDLPDRLMAEARQAPAMTGQAVATTTITAAVSRLS